MEAYNLMTAIQILEVSIAPVVLISGVGLIILSQTNRMAQIINRVRQLNTVDNLEKKDQYHFQVQLLYRRARRIRFSLISLLLCIFFDALVIIDIFSSRIVGYDNGIPTAILFSISLVFLIFGLAAFILDVNMNLKALKIEIKD